MSPKDRRRGFGLIRPAIDAHDLGIASFAAILRDCGLRVSVADRELREAASAPEAEANGRELRAWILREGIGAIGFSYRLDPEDALRRFAAFRAFLEAAGLLASSGGPVGALYFAGLPRACDLVLERFPAVDGVFRGDESRSECLAALGFDRRDAGAALAAEEAYDEARMAFGRALALSGEHLRVGPVDRSGSPRYGRRGDCLAARVEHGEARGLPPLVRAHVGPYLPDRREAVALFLDWASRLARGGLLDVLSIGSSQLSQSRFGEDWEGLPDGGGVPLATPEEYGRAWEAARPMLVRTYSGAKDVPALARMYEERIDIAWHALSLWWFCAIDGRGPNSVSRNLEEHLRAMSYAAQTGKPVEPNVPHHFAFRGADDVSYVVSGYVAAKAAKARGVRQLVLQTMLNTPKSTWGVQDLAKARALLELARGLEGPDFRVYFQPRAGLDYFSRDEEKAKAQLAAATALMDDVEPGNDRSPQVIHVVSWCEGQRLADPGVVEDSVRITRHALAEYRELRRQGGSPLAAAGAEVAARTEALLSDARAVVAAIEGSVEDPYSARGLYEVLASGFFPLPLLAELRDEFPEAARRNTAWTNGGVSEVDAEGAVVPPAERAREAAEVAGRRRGRRDGERG